jgi:tRNA/rRNA methyltransferase
MARADGPSIILVKPQMGENIGASARAMANFGLKDLSLVDPRDGWPSAAADANSVGAFDHMNAVKVYDSVTDAIADAHTVYATTARPRDMRKPVFAPAQAVEDMIAKGQRGMKTAILFGGERAGLDNDDIALAQNIITFPTNPDFSSLNLAQSVLLLSYEYFRQANDAPAATLPEGKSPAATQGEVEEFLARLESELEDGHFFRNPDMRPAMVRNIRAMFTRADLSEQEVRTLHGMVSALIGKKQQ